MTREQKHQMLDMRLDGYSFEDIGERFGVSKQRIQQILSGKDSGKRNATSKQNRLDRYIFPKIAIWMNEHDYTLVMMAEEIGVSPTTLSGQLLGKNEPPLKTVRKIIEITGMPFEVAFERRVENETPVYTGGTG